jgi:hypothetical protein
MADADIRPFDASAMLETQRQDDLGENHAGRQ